MSDLMNIDKRVQQDLNALTGFASYIHTWESRQFLKTKEKTIGLFFGNQRGKGAMACMGYVHRIMGTHPVPERNVLYFKCDNGHTFSPAQWLSGFELRYKDSLCPECAKPNRKEVKPHIRNSRIFRFAGDVLPESEGKHGKRDAKQETKSVQFPEFIKWCPSFLIKEMPSTRRNSVVVKDIYGGQDIVIELVSYKMPVKHTRGHQRISIWADELGSEDFYQEQKPRLMMENGDFIITYTVTEDTESTVLFDQIYDNASVYYRSKIMIEDYYKKIKNVIKPQIERINNGKDIAVFESASDDNPLLTKEQVEEYLMEYEDPDVRMMRRYCAFQQLSAKIFPQFKYATHCVDMENLFAL